MGCVRVSKYLLFSLRVNDLLRLGSTAVAVLCRCVFVVISFFGLTVFLGTVRVCVTGLFVVVVAVREKVRGKSEKEHTDKELHIIYVSIKRGKLNDDTILPKKAIEKSNY